VGQLSRWWNGEQVGASPLFGSTVLFWGRVGKLLQFAAGLVGVAKLARIRDVMRGWVGDFSGLIAKLTWTSLLGRGRPVAALADDGRLLRAVPATASPCSSPAASRTTARPG
jgi:hypothetical protein